MELVECESLKKLLTGRWATFGSIVVLLDETEGIGCTKASPICARRTTAVKPRKSMLRKKEVVVVMLLIGFYSC